MMSGFWGKVRVGFTDLRRMAMKPGVMAHTCNSCTGEAEAGGLHVLGQAGV
jgi:hypothetical protein